MLYFTRDDGEGVPHCFLMEPIEAMLCSNAQLDKQGSILRHHNCRQARWPTMSDKSEKMRQAEQQVTEELANQAHAEPGSKHEDTAKENRARAEKDLLDAQNSKE
jgi:hypothetical protein